MEARWRSWVCSRKDSCCNAISLWQLPGTGIFGWNCCQKQPEVFLQFWQQWNTHGVVSVSPNSLFKRDILKNLLKQSVLFVSKFVMRYFIFLSKFHLIFIFLPFWIKIFNLSEFKNSGPHETWNKMLFQFWFTKYFEVCFVSVGPKLISYLFRASS